MDIKKIIKERGFTSAQVAEALDISRGALSQIVNGDSVTTKNLRRIANVIGCNVADFFKDEASEKETYIICPHCGEKIKISVSK
jgi:transcriptional regulator with XRE-family HTH domain